MELKQRKTIRLKNYDYSSVGAYFITVCIKERAEMLSHITPAKDELSMPENELLWHGEIADKYIKQMASFYDNIKIDKYIIMPNHIHFILKISGDGKDTPDRKLQHSLISDFIRLFKRYCNKEYGENIWQRGSNDHIIRNDEQYTKIWDYIEHNTLKWEQDCFYIDNM